MDVLCPFKIKIESQNSDHGCIKDQQTYPNQDQDAKPKSETSSFLHSPNEALKEIDVLCTFEIKIEIPNRIMVVSKTSDHIEIKIKMPNPSQEPPSSSKASN